MPDDVDDALRVLERAISMRDNFFEAAAHDLRSPLTVVVLQLDTLLKQEAPHMSERTLKGLTAVRKQIDHLVRLTDRLTDVVRIDNGTFELVPEEHDLAALASDVAQRFEAQLQWAGCPLSIDAPSPVRVQVDRVRLDEAVGNLLVNAAKYAPGTPVKLGVGEEGDRAILCVADRGPGIPASMKEAIFEKFGRLATGSVPGLGLGLWISRRIVEAHGGSLHVDDTPGGGATFVVALPHAGARDTSALATTALDAGKTGAAR